jgi:gamma-glutamylcyclotransferase (GGCT)/AIG2-like uncharacterized protein YtfP
MGIARDTSLFANSVFANSLFVYGTLRDDDVLRIVLGYDLPAHRRRRAVLNDFDRRMLHDESYPVLVPAPGGCVPGCVLMLDEADMRRISFFEADEYSFESAQVVDELDGQLQDVFLCAEHATRPGPRYPWSLRDWRREHKPIFVENARAYMALYDTMSAAQADDVWKKLTGRGDSAASRVGEPAYLPPCH